MWAGLKGWGLATVESNFQNQNKIAILGGPPDGTADFSRKTQLLQRPGMEEAWEHKIWPHSPSIQSANVSHQQNPNGDRRIREPGAIHRGQPPTLHSKVGKKWSRSEGVNGKICNVW